MISSLVDHENCTEDICVTTFEDFNTKNETIKISVLAINDFGISDLVSYPSTIGKL